MRLGSDPEVFLVNKQGLFKSVIGLIGAGKDNPRQMAGLPTGFTEQEDNVALEFGIPPASDRDEFISYIQTVQKDFLNRHPQFSFSGLSCTVFPEEEMQNPMAYIFGCEPDFNAWTKKVNKKPTPPHKFMRSAGGHIHVETKLDKFEGVKAMDLCLGVPSTIMDNGIERKKLYGSMGAFRPKPYGFEYRVLSNYWIFDEKLTGWAWDQTERALELVKQGVNFKDYQKEITEAINNNNKEVAHGLIKHFNLTLV